MKLLAIALAGVAWLSASALDIDAAAQAGDVLFFDGFDEDSLDRQSWNVIVTGPVVNNEQQAYIDSPDTIDFVTGNDAEGAEGGALALRALHRPGTTTAEGRTFDFVSGRLDTRDKVTFTYGTASASVWTATCITK